ncbi:hypothetical protein N658DRAFT_496762 [Parathielavia hyrcaniae]|uniref:Pentatricopeptide repeat domain-containing protein n=1 Tax=Parathielavia hyrcaniae TaxID=113614 RepID=A0AAN6Q4Y8_9PEZI|nr:hypothetical protein N658DRAFT_496762 [Parathielavia hyrcaniae]
MLGLWSMAAQLRACHCRACLRATNPVLRRATTSSAPNSRRRKVLASDVFTACYTAFMATAAVLDARRKDERRRDLDGKIAQAKSTLSAMLEQSAARDLATLVDSSYPEVFDSPPLEKEEVLNRLGDMRHRTLRDLGQTLNARLKSVSQMRVSLGMKWRTEIPEGTVALARCEKVLAAEEREMAMSEHREPRSETHMERFSDMVTDLVDRLMAEAWWATEMQWPGKQRSPSSPDSANTMVRMLRSDGYPSYAHPDLNRRETIKQRTQLNELNLTILNKWEQRKRVQLVAKICYNLLVCGTPPSIENYNTLILGFSLLGEHNLSQAVVDSFLFVSSLKPTQATYLCLLHHYRLKRDIVGFHRLIQRLIGRDPRGIGLTRRSEEAVARQRSLQEWAATEDVALANGYYVLRPPITAELAEAMMEGLIDFGMLRYAARLFAACLAEEWSFHREVLWRFFHSCLVMVDTATVNIIIQGLLHNIDKASLLLLGPSQVHRPIVRQLRYFLSMAHAARLPTDDGAEKGEEPSPGTDTVQPRRAEFNHLVTAIWIRETWDYSRYMGIVLRMAEVAISYGWPNSRELDDVLRALDSEVEHPWRKMAEVERNHRLARMDWLAAELEGAYQLRGKTESAITTALAKSTPRKLRTPAQFSPKIPFRERMALALRYAATGTLGYRVGLCFELSKEIDLQLKMALIQALPPSYAEGLEQTQTDSGDVRLGRVVSYVEHYLASLMTREAVRRREEKKPDPFARLLEALPKVNLSFRKASAEASF